MWYLIDKEFWNKWETRWIQILVYWIWAFDWAAEEMTELYVFVC